MRLLVSLSAILQLASAFSLPGAPLPAATRRSAPASMNFFENAMAAAKANIETATDNMKQMSDQRIAHISHVMLRTDPAALNVRTKGECYECLTGWKETIGDDEEKFAICARERSECASKDDGGDLGWKVRGQMSKQFNDIVFTEEPGKVYGPFETDKGLHLLYLHSCGEPEDMSRTYPDWMVKAGIGKNEEK